MANKWIEGREGATIPILMVAVIVIVYALFQSLFIQCNPDIAKCKSFSAVHIFPSNTEEPKDEIDKLKNGGGQDEEKKRKLIAEKRKLIAERYSGRLVWVFFATISVLLCIAAQIVSYRMIYKSSSFRNESASTRANIFIGLSFLFGLILWHFTDSYTPIMKDVLRETISKMGVESVPVITGTMDIINSLIYVASFSLVIVSCTILLPRESISKINTGDEDALPKEPNNIKSEPSDEPNELDPISEQMKDLRLVLYTGTFLLIVGVLHLSAITQWSLAFISPDALEAAKSFYISQASVTGGFYTLILGAVYLPAAYILQRRAQLLATKLPPDKQEEVLKSRGFTFSFRESLPRIFAIFGPFLAGPIGEIFKALPT